MGVGYDCSEGQPCIKIVLEGKRVLLGHTSKYPQWITKDDKGGWYTYKTLAFLHKQCIKIVPEGKRAVLGHTSNYPTKDNKKIYGHTMTEYDQSNRKLVYEILIENEVVQC